jgi:hypothetical protein
MRRRGIAFGSVLTLGFLLWPALHPSELDSLPISNYPMFAHRREAVSQFDFAVLDVPFGGQRRLSAAEVGGSGEPVQAAMTLRQAIEGGAVLELCRELAATVDEGVVQVVTATYDAVAWFRGDHRPRTRLVHVECPAGSQ